MLKHQKRCSRLANGKQMVKKYETGFREPEDIERLYAEFARLTLQVQMKKRDLGYRQLTDLFNDRFRKTGLKENERNMRNKIARGTFSAAFFLMCMNALDCKSLDLTTDDLRLVSKPWMSDRQDGGQEEA